MRHRLTAIAGLSCVLLSACTEGPVGDSDAVRAGQRIYAKECAACHGTGGEGAGLKQRNDGYFPREFVRRFIMGRLEKDDPASPMPDFSTVGLRHVYPEGGADGEVLETDFANLLDYLEAIQE